MLRKTALHQSHIDLGAKMGEFAGYDMPLFYKDGVMKEHQWVRSHAGVFDVSHMGQVIIEGPDAVEALERLTPSSFSKKKNGQAQYTVLTNEQGGIIDDLIITRLGENKFFTVLNAGCKEKDIAWIKEHLPSGVHLYHKENHALIALQGPWSERILHEYLEFDARDLPYMHLAEATDKYGTPIYISRLGYTGEDGFEISVPNDDALEIWEMLAGHPEIGPAGLAVRDALRLEMGYPLYGHDIDDTTTPVEADLNWIIGKDNKGFIGAETVLKQREAGPERKRAGIKITDKGIAREGADILDGNENKIGTLTSGGFSPALECGIGMGYVPPEMASPGTKLFVNVRGKNLAAEVTKMPFIEAKTKSMKSKAA